MTDDALQEVRALIQRGQRIDAIKRYRELTGLGLKESVEAVTRLEEGKSPPPPAAPLSPDGELRQATMEQLLGKGQKIEAIRLHRELTGAGLKESKEAVDALETQLRRSGDLPLPEEPRVPRHLVRLVLAAVLLALALIIGAHLGRG